MTGLRDDVERIVTSVETIEESLAVLSEKRTLDRAAYKRDADTRDIVERRFVKAAEAALDTGDVLLRHEHGRPPASNADPPPTLDRDRRYTI
ncbi:MAG: HepT-like ribonuclease domain-containing protein [Halobacteriales archaeon]